MLDFEGGEIHDIRRPTDQWEPYTIELVIEHPDLDKVEPGFILRRVTPTYILSRRYVERLDPPKLEE